MVTTTRCLHAVAALAIAAVVPMIVNAQGIAPECKPLKDAVYKQMTTTNHMFMTDTDASTRGKPELSETITVGNQLFIKASNRWIKSPVSPQDMVKEMQGSEKGHVTTCRKSRTETVGGVPSTVWEMREKTEDNTITGQYWIANATGLILRSETDMDDGSKMGKSHSSIRIEYTNVQAPPGIK